MEVRVRVTCCSSAIINHILARFLDRVSQQGVIDMQLFDHQII